MGMRLTVFENPENYQLDFEKKKGIAQTLTKQTQGTEVPVLYLVNIHEGMRLNEAVCVCVCVCVRVCTVGLYITVDLGQPIIQRKMCFRLTNFLILSHCFLFNVV